MIDLESAPGAWADVRLSAGDVIRLEYFHSAASAGSVLGGAALSQFQISRLSLTDLRPTHDHADQARQWH